MESGICLCCGVYVEGERTVSRPKPYRPMTVFGGKDDPEFVVLIKATNTGGAHEIPYKEKK